ncbi:MAG TPA: helix-turn-helix domain-containing protein [bacterium]|nr:helix-turn-helix domain-containing protein [bacterium]
MAVPLRQARIEDAGTARELLHPMRARILAGLRSPASATQVARALGLPAARVNHHVRRLRKAGLIRRAGTRRVRNLTEVLYVALARTFTIAEGITPGGEQRRRLRATEEGRSLRNLMAVGERVAADSLGLLDDAAAGDRDVSAFATSLDLAFADAGARAAFLADLLAAVRELSAKYGAQPGDDPDERYRAVIACYPGNEIPA